ncbi:MAG TPA: zf-HC2 domain-containing protein [Gemmatimonadaceae bacterium]|nr:zf-HC2 domain-containing protein [Gemmatimonadaceae bacterium]
MNRCTELDIKEMLPDLLHGKLDADARARVEAHVVSCEECTEEVEVLRTVKSVAVFIPAIDVDRVVRQIPPYRTIVPAAQAPARSRVVSWLVAASLVVVVLGGGSLLMIQMQPTLTPVATVDHSGLPDRASTQAEKPVGIAPIIAPNGTGISAKPTTHALALATGVDGLSDNNLRQLMNDMNNFDALPATEPGPVISVDNGDGLDQGSR